jgi:type I restriction enzyme R subunit
MPNGEYEVPKTLIFAKTDSHAEDIIAIVREEFGEGNEFCKKVTYQSKEDPKSVLNRFRNDFHPRIAVTVDMIATGTDVKPLEVLLFMRDVRSVNYFEQMKGRGTRTIAFDDLQRVTSTAKFTKTHFVIVDAVGAMKSKKTDSRPLERKPNVPLKDLLGAVTMGAQDEDLFLTLANRLMRLDKQLTEPEQVKFTELTGGKNIHTVVKDLLTAYDPDAIAERSEALINKIAVSDRTPTLEESALKQAQSELADLASANFNGELNTYLENVRKVHEQIIDTINQDKILKSEFDAFSVDKARVMIQDFTDYIAANRDEIVALSLFYDQPYRRRELTYRMVQDLLEKLKADRPMLAPTYVWDAYKQLENVRVDSPKNELVALVALIRRVTGIDNALTPYDKTIDRNFQNWVFGKQAGALKFTEEQMRWLRMMKEHIMSSFHIDVDDLEYTPFDAEGGVGKMYQLFGDRMGEIIEELNEALAA